MCRIAGGEDADAVEKLTASLQHRGQSTTVEGTDFTLGHVLHPVVNHIEQPIHGTGRLTANCEIYNWQKLATEQDISAENDADLLLRLLDAQGMEILDELDGVYAFAYVTEAEAVLARDLLGVKPVWYVEDPFLFASERQALEALGYTPRELHPRQMLRYNRETGAISLEQRSFFDIAVDEDLSLEDAAEAVKDKFLNAVEKRVPDTEVALLFSGGVDSTMVAAALQALDVDFTAYTAGVQYGNVNAPRDVEWAERVADEMGFPLEVYNADLDAVEANISDTVNWISSTSVVKTGVALPFHLALQGDEPVVFSGLGSEQLYAGYNRHQGYLNKECLSGLRRLWERDLYRDDVIAMRNGYELRVPFLDQELVAHALTIPGEYKVKDDYRKYVVRKAAEKLGVPEDVAWRKKTAAQYGSNFDKALGKIAKNNGFRHKQPYLNQFRNTSDHRLGALFSGGKDSSAALYRMARRNNDIRCLINMQSQNENSYMFDPKEKRVVAEQAEALGTPLLVQETQGEKEEELDDLKTAVLRAKNEYGIDGIVAGALASTYQRDRVEQVAEATGMKVFAPLWQEDPASYMKWLVREGFEIQITKVAARGLSTDWVGKTITEENVDDLLQLAEEHRFNAAGEGGEYETRVVQFPEQLEEQSQ